MAKTIIIVLVVTVIGLVVLQFVDPNSSMSVFKMVDTSNTINVNNGNTSNDENTGSFSISGCVINPGTYLLTIEDATMETLIDAAGGITSNADDRCYYLEAEISDGESYYIPTKYDTSNICGGDIIAKVNINSDDEGELQKIAGIGSTLASSIVNYRDSYGLFYTLEAIKNVSGIGTAKFNQIKDYIILHD